MQVQASMERRSDSIEQLHSLLKSRTETLILFSQLAGFRPFQPRIEVKQVLQEFCESLVDYTASAHFQLYRFIDEGKERRRKVREVADKVYPLITAYTEKILDFNDKYDSEEECETLSALDTDLSSLGEVLAERIQEEDKLIAALADGAI